jgi:transcriptional regulator with XRE-family HTH domain
MKTLSAMLDALAERAGSDRKIGPMLGASMGAVTQWRTERSYPDDDKARKIAELLDLDPAYVLAVIHGERAKSDATRAAWRRVADAFGFDKARAARTPPARRARNTQCSTARRAGGAFAETVLQSLGLGEQHLAL